MAVAHYLDALAWQRDVVAIQAILGGKSPHPNLVVGGVPCAVSVESGAQAGTALDVVGLELIRGSIARMREFVDQAYVPDTLAIAGWYPDWFKQGEGIGNFMCYGDFPARGWGEPDSWLVPGGVILNRDLTHIEPVDLRDESEIQEFITRSWYDYRAGKQAGLHPAVGETTLAYRGPDTPYTELPVEGEYSWLKAPRWRGKPVEVGPLARVLMLYVKGHEQTRELVDRSLKTLNLPVDALYSTMGRTAARTLETKVMVDALDGWYRELVANIRRGERATFSPERWDPATWPRQCRGVGHLEAPRGALAHWVEITDGRVSNYQAVVPSTWNAGPRDPQDQAGPYEAALAGHPVNDPAQPLEILRTIHSFDPCIACAVHIIDPGGEDRLQIGVH